MASIALVVRPLRADGHPTDGVVPFIDGHDLVDLVIDAITADGSVGDAGSG